MPILTEDEAKTKWCPYSFSASGDGPLMCRAAGCMAWRKEETPEFKANAEYVFRSRGQRLVIDTGYCGLVGRPT